MSGRMPPNPAPDRKSFGEFIAAVENGLPAVGLPADHVRRLRLAAYGIDSLTKLQTWARLRWPTWYTCRGGEKYDGPTGKQVMEQFFADYLSWAEAE